MARVASEINLLELDEEELKRRLKNGEIVVSIYGLGRVGIPLACAWLRAGARVIGVDINEDKVKMLNRGECPIDEPRVPEVIREYVSKGLFIATTDGVSASRNSNIKIITVSTTLKRGLEAIEFNLTPLRKALNTISSGLKIGDMVIIEASVPPGTTEKVARPILESSSGLIAERDFGLAYSPERIAEGRALYDIEEAYPKIVSGIGAKSTKVVKALYSVISKKGVIVMSSTTAAEFEKLAEGIYRDVNIALANELAKLAHALALDFTEIREAANSQPYCNLHLPGVGVGGACLPIYPYFMERVAKEQGIHLELTMTARRINEGMPKYVSNLVISALERLGTRPSDAKVAILGDSFRGNVADSRLSPTHDLVNELKARGINRIVVHDPLIKEDKELKASLSNNLNEVIRESDVIIISTDHDLYKKLTLRKIKEISRKRKIVVIDGRNILRYDDIPINVIYVGIGRPWVIS